MTEEIVSALSGYIQVLYELNQKLIKLCGTSISRKYEYSHKEILDIVQEIPRVIPYEYNKKKKCLELVDKNGLLEYKKSINYLESKYLEILDDNRSFLDNVRKIRNKYEHKMHDVKRITSISGNTSYFEFEFEVDGKVIVIEAKDFIKVIKKLNSLFSLIVKEIVEYVKENEKEDNPYYRRLSRFDFEEFNKIYESGLLRTFGKLMLDF